MKGDCVRSLEVFKLLPHKLVVAGENREIYFVRTLCFFCSLYLVGVISGCPVFCCFLLFFLVFCSNTVKL